jgi:hypothetical protein
VISIPVCVSLHKYPPRRFLSSFRPRRGGSARTLGDIELVRVKAELLKAVLGVDEPRIVVRETA